jgi:choline monooxygenase
VWIHAGRLPHPLPASAYFGATQHAREAEEIFAPSFGFALARSELRTGEERAIDLGARLVVVRRAGDGRIAAREGRGAPERRAFHDLDVACLGELVFVRARSAPAGSGHQPREPSAEPCSQPSDEPNAEPFDEATRRLAEEAFTTSHRLVWSARLDHPCNWKVALENVLETYHVPVLHDSAWVPRPEVFRLFTGTPAGVETHRLGRGSTTYRDSMGAHSGAYRFVAERMRAGFTADYTHHHAFPNLILGRTHLVSFVQSVWPTSPTTSESHVRLFLYERAGASAAGRLATRAAGRLAAVFMRRVLGEDAAIYRSVQRGVEASPHAGVLSAREERVHAFQEWVADVVGGANQSRPHSASG